MPNGFLKPIPTHKQNEPLEHDMQRAERNPNEFFDASWYLEQNRDVRELGVDPLQHYIELGWKEGRDPRPNLSVKAYLDRYPDVRDAGLEPLLDITCCMANWKGALWREAYSLWIDRYNKLEPKARRPIAKRIARLPLGL